MNQLIRIDEEDEKLIDNVCLSFRHDFGLMSEEDKNKLRFECNQWMRALVNNAKVVESDNNLKVIIDFCELQIKVMENSITPDKGEHYIYSMRFAMKRMEHVINLSNVLMGK